jgi:hypothetical protein
MITYSLKPAEKEGDEELVVKVGHPYEFTASQVAENMFNLQKTIKELTAQLAYEKAKLTNIEQFHPDVLTLAPETLAACKLYLETKILAEKVQEALIATQTTVDSHLGEIAEIEKQTGKVIELKEGPQAQGEFVKTEEAVVDASAEGHVHSPTV